MSNSYQIFGGLEKLGDRAMQQKNYRKAIEYYEKAVVCDYRGPSYSAVVRKLDEARIHIEKTTATGKKGAVFIKDGIFKPTSMLIRLYTNEHMQENEWGDLLKKIFGSFADSDKRLHSIIMQTEDSIDTKASWEFVPYEYEGFVHVAMKSATNWAEQCRLNEQAACFTTFAKDGTIAPKERAESAQFMIFIIFFGSEKA
jgi:hypothetical protein